MEIKKDLLEENDHSKQKNISLNSIEEKKIDDAQKNEDIETALYNTDNLDTEKDKDIESLSKIFKLIEHKKDLSYILEEKFNIWKDLTFQDDEELIERKIKKIFIKKTLNIHREKKDSEIEKEKPKTIKILKQAKPIKSNNIERKRKKKIIELIQSRISSYVTKKEILKKYFERWNNNIYTMLETEKNVSEVVRKKKISLSRKKEQQKEEIKSEQKDIDTNNKEIEIDNEEKEVYNEKISALKNIISFQDPLALYFNIWRSLSEHEEVETYYKKKKILIKRIYRDEDIEEIEEPKRSIKIKKKNIPIKSNEEWKRKKKLIKFIESRIYSYQSKRSILRKYFKRWVSYSNIGAKKKVIASESKKISNKPEQIKENELININNTGNNSKENESITENESKIKDKNMITIIENNINDNNEKNKIKNNDEDKADNLNIIETIKNTTINEKEKTFNEKPKSEITNIKIESKDIKEENPKDNQIEIKNKESLKVENPELNKFENNEKNKNISLYRRTRNNWE